MLLTATPPSVQVDVIEDAGRLAALRSEWTDLLHNSAADGPFLTWEWLQAWWTHLGGTRQLRLFTVREGQTLIALAPTATTRDGLFPALEFLGTGHAGSDYLDIVVRRGHEAEALRALASSLDAAGLALRFDHLPPASVSSRLSEHLGARGWSSLREPGGVCPFIRLAGQSWESYLQSLGRAHRANVRRRLSALARQFDVRFEPVATEDGRREIVAALSRFHRARFTERGGSTAFDSPALRAFHDAALQAAAEAGWLRLYALRLDGALAAAMYGFMYEKRFFFYQHGFDDRFGRFSVGLVLMALTIREAIAEGATEFDMLFGTESYKALWTRQHRPLDRVSVFPAHLGGRLHHAMTSARRAVKQIAKRIRQSSHGTPTCLPDDRLAGAGA